MCGAKKKKDGEIDQNRSRKWKLNKRVRNNIKEMPQTIHRRDNKV